MLAVVQHILRHKIDWQLPAFETADFTAALCPFPETVIPERRRTREFVTSVFARNEVFRPEPGALSPKRERAGQGADDLRCENTGQKFIPSIFQGPDSPLTARYAGLARVRPRSCDL